MLCRKPGGAPRRRRRRRNVPGSSAMQDRPPSRADQDDLEPSECQCYTVKGSGACTSAAARLFGAKAGGIAQGLFWSWAGARLGTVYSNASTWAEGLLEIEVWSSGGRSLNPAVQSTVEAASWETACLQILCFCGGMECRSESWSSLGTLEYGTTFDSAWSLNEANDSVNAETSVVTNDPDLVNLSFAWGIQVSSEPLSGETGLSFSRTLVLEDLDSQRQLLAFCEGTAPDLEIVQRSCWPIDFKRWLQERGSYYPVVPNTFYGSLRQFFDEKARRAVFGSDGQPGAERFLAHRGGHRQGLVLHFPSGQGLRAPGQRHSSHAGKST
ncbi:Patched domain-containing protein 2 [Durusdinium trenchii]|uniref:Patched domain-containing protein 2 n=1 Tax=Durusdinium trenchii TaxID=1381693 RepID=A0ABP0Q1T8_9DINO